MLRTNQSCAAPLPRRFGKGVACGCTETSMFFYGVHTLDYTFLGGPHSLEAAARFQPPHLPATNVHNAARFCCTDGAMSPLHSASPRHPATHTHNTHARARARTHARTHTRTEKAGKRRPMSLSGASPYTGRNAWGAQQPASSGAVAPGAPAWTAHGTDYGDSPSSTEHLMDGRNGGQRPIFRGHSVPAVRIDSKFGGGES